MPASGSAESSRRNSIGSCDGSSPIKSSRAGLAPSQSVADEYIKAFPPFFVHQYTTMAPILHPPVEKVELALDAIFRGSEVSSVTTDTLPSLSREALHLVSARPKKWKRYIVPPSVKELVSKLNGSAWDSVDLTTTSTASMTPTKAEEVLRNIPIKYLKYHEDVRPPWKGTRTKPLSRTTFRKLCRTPYARVIPEINYEYDSEAEWEEPGEGEELLSEDEEEDDGDNEDLEGFLDDEGDEGAVLKRRQILGDLEPICTLVHWESSEPGNQSRNVAYGQSTIDLASFKIQVLLRKSCLLRLLFTSSTNRLRNYPHPSNRPLLNLLLDPLPIHHRNHRHRRLEHPPEHGSPHPHTAPSNQRAQPTYIHEAGLCRRRQHQGSRETLKRQTARSRTPPRIQERSGRQRSDETGPDRDSEEEVSDRDEGHGRADAAAGGAEGGGQAEREEVEAA